MTVIPDETRLVVIESADVGERVTQALALDAARKAARAQLEPTTRSGRLFLEHPGGWMRVLGTSLPSLGIFGYKEFHLTGQGAVRYAVHLFAIDDGRPLGVVDGALLTPLRTAAAAAAAAGAYLHDRSSPVSVGVVGSSTEAEAGLRALASALPIDRVVVTSRNEKNRTRFAARMSQELGVRVDAVCDARSLSECCEVVYVATASGGRVVVDDAALGDVPLVLSIGSTLPVQRELHADILINATTVIIDTPEVLQESGDVLAAIEQGLEQSSIHLLGEYLDAPGSDGGRTVYKSIGSPVQDLVLAAAILEQARQQGFGRSSDPLSAVKLNRS